MIRKVQQTVVCCTAAMMNWVFGLVLTAVLLAFQISTQMVQAQDDANMLTASSIAPPTDETNSTSVAPTADSLVSASVPPTIGSPASVTNSIFNPTSGSIPGKTAGNPLLLLALLLVVPVYAWCQ